MSPSKIVLSLIIIICFQSCTKNVDFDQIDDASIHTSYVSTLVYLNLTAPKFLDTFNQEIAVTTDAVEATITQDSKPYLEKVEFTVLTNNSFPRNFELSIIFYDAFGIPIYTLQPTIVAPPNSSELTTIIEIPQVDIPIIYETKSFGFYIYLSPSSDGSIISMNDTATLDLKSSVKLFFNYQKI